MALDGGRKRRWRVPRPTQRMFWIALVCGVAIPSCAGVGGSGEARGKPTPQITPREVVVIPGQIRRLTVANHAQVDWGIAESGPRARLPLFPLKVAPNGRYLMDREGRPWRVQADAGWLMSALATPAQVDEYLATREAQGFNAFYLHIMVHPGGYPTAPNAPNDKRGNPPLATAGDYSTAGETPASERYWDWIDSIVDKAAAQHMVVMVAYGYLGWHGGNQGWYQEVLNQPSKDTLYQWGLWLGNRYKSKPNIIWLGLGDFAPPDGSEGASRARAMAEGIKAAGARQLFMAEAAPPDSVPSDVPYFRSVVDMNSFYGYGPDGLGAVYETADRAFGLSPTKPAWMQEGTYEYENNLGHFSGEPWDTRRGRFWSVLAGGTAGDGFGSRDSWQWKDFPHPCTRPERSTRPRRLTCSRPSRGGNSNPRGRSGATQAST